MKDYRNYIFDLYGTLVDIGVDESDRRLWEHMSLFYGYYGAQYEPGTAVPPGLCGIGKR